MDIVRFGREVSGHLAWMGLSLVGSAGLVIGLYYLNPLELYQLSYIMPFFIFIALIGMFFALSGFLFLVMYQFDEYRFLRKWEFDETPISYRLPQEALAPAFLLDTIDREILQITSSTGGDILAVKNQIKNRALAQNDDEMADKLSHLVNAEMVGLSKKLVTKRLYLTPMGHEAMHTPAVAYTSRIPIRVRRHMYRARRNIWREQWGQAVLEIHKAMEAAYKILLRTRAETDTVISDVVKEAEENGRPLDERTSGSLHNLLIQADILEKGSFERHLSDEISKTRRYAHDSPEEQAYEADDAILLEQYLGILMKRLFT